MESEIKEFYSIYHDRIFDKRFNSPHPIRRRVHREMYSSVCDKVQAGMTVLDAGCGEGVLSIMMAEKGAAVTGVDYSAPNVEAAIERARDAGFGTETIHFEVGDAENLAFEDDSFDCIVSNHVLEHLPDFERGLREIFRVTSDLAVIAVPTCVNPCSWVLLGGDVYWKFSKRSLFSLPFGLSRTMWALCRGEDGVNEGYAGRKENVHVFRFPWVVKRLIRAAGFTHVDHEAQSLCVPYLPLRLGVKHTIPVINNFGIGTVYVARKKGP